MHRSLSPARSCPPSRRRVKASLRIAAVASHTCGTLLILAAATLALQGCQPSTPADPPAPMAATSDPSLEHTPPQSDARGNVPAPAAPVDLPNAALLPAPGPYLIHRLGGGTSARTFPTLPTDLAIRHADGTLAATWRLPDGGYIRDVGEALSPDGRWLAFVSGDVPDWHLTAPITSPLKLVVWDLVEGREAFSQPLLHDGLRNELRGQAMAWAEVDTWEDAGSAGDLASSPLSMATLGVVDALLTGLGEVAWSPNGDQLAIIGAMEGPSSDVFVVDTGTWQIRRASDEATHVIRMAWSPDGRWILHEGATAMSVAAGSSLAETTDVSAADGSPMRHVWSGSGIGGWGDGSWPDGWLGDHDAVVHREDNGCGVCNMLRIDASTGITTTLVDAMEGGQPVVAPEHGVAAISGSIYDRVAREEKSSGIQLLSLDNVSVAKVSDLPCPVAGWGTSDLPFVWLSAHSETACSPTAFGLGGRTKPLAAPAGLTDVSVSPAGRWRVLYGEGGWRMYDAASEHVGDWTAGEVAAVTWRPDEAGLIWQSGDQLWYAEAPDGVAGVVGALPEADGGWPETLDVAWLQK